jgi:hypothetical protein
MSGARRWRWCGQIRAAPSRATRVAAWIGLLVSGALMLLLAGAWTLSLIG